MFNVCTVEDKLRVSPSELGKPTLEAVTAEIQNTYIDKVLPNLGLAITLYDILKISEGFVFPSDGGVHFHVEFRLVVFKPFVGQVLQGQLKACDKWVPPWQPVLCKSMFVPCTIVVDLETCCAARA